MCNKTSVIRNRKMQAQNGRCYYCDCLMWTGDFVHFQQLFGLTLKQLKYFQCTAEHLIPKSDNGRDVAENVVAACRYCNATRHAGKIVLEPEAYKEKVKNRLKRGGWHRIPVAKIGLLVVSQN